MYYFGYLMLIVALLAAFSSSALALGQLWSRQHTAGPWIEKAHYVVSGAFLLASAALLHALFWQDYSLVYAASYTDRYLSLFYRLTAFWAGQPGSMLFWALAIACTGTLFARLSHYKRLETETKLWFWVFFQLIIVFFAVLLATYSNPFVMQTPVPQDGNGLNPLLQNPGMIIHPPLLFIGYAGFVVPTCLALAQSVRSQTLKELHWQYLSRPFLLTAWMFLTAGIMLGAWWAYMELGWGGYWAWDPVENSSLIPWLIATALLHALVLERRTRTFARFNVLLVALVTASTLFATFLVRSGIIDSVHAFGQSAVGTPLFCAVVIMTVISTACAFLKPKHDASLPELSTREGLLAVMTWFLLALAVIILLATVWPVLTKLFSSTPGGLDASFYNRVCLPLAAVLLLLLAFCPSLTPPLAKVRGWLLFLVMLFLGLLALLWVMDLRQPAAMLATAASALILLQILRLCIPALQGKRLRKLGALGAHLGLALAALGIAFSGPYSLDREIELAQGEQLTVENYTLSLAAIREMESPGYASLLIELFVQKDGKPLGTLMPERRIYEKFGEMQFSEVDTLFSLTNELYASLLGISSEKKAVIRFSIKPYVNWLWIGGFLMSLLPLFGLAKQSEAKNPEEEHSA